MLDATFLKISGKSEKKFFGDRETMKRVFGTRFIFWPSTQKIFSPISLKLSGKLRLAQTSPRIVYLLGNIKDFEGEVRKSVARGQKTKRVLTRFVFRDPRQ